MQVHEDVTRELTEMKKCGIRVTDKALAYPEANQDEMNTYRGDGMDICEIAEIVIELTDVA